MDETSKDGRPGYDRVAAVSRNIGWVTPQEQVELAHKRVAVAGLGGVGGVHLLTLARLGIGSFHIADFDRFEAANMNRQVGALVSTLGIPKVEALAAQVRDIHPEVDLVTFPQGVTPDSIDAFLDGVDLFVDGLDFFAFDTREAVFDACRQRGIPAITVAPLGMGAALLNFLPEGMSFRSYFRWQGCDDAEKAIRFLVGLAPALMQRGYLVHASAVDLSRQRGPSTAMACKLCAGVAGTEALKILLGRPGVLAAPWGMQFDAYRYRAKRTWRPGGNANPLQRLAIAIARKSLRAR